MKVLGIGLALVLLSFVVYDASYMVRAWSAFEADDARHHIQFQVLSLVVVTLYFSLAVLSWRREPRVHRRLTAALLALVGLVMAHSLFWPLAHHASEVEGASFGAAAFNGTFLVAAAAIAWWSWRGYRAQPVVPLDVPAAASRRQGRE